MIGTVGYKAWSRGSQIGLRIYAGTVRKLRTQMVYSSVDAVFKNLDQWLRKLESGEQPQRYSRRAIVVLPGGEIEKCTLTISTLPPRSPQGYVTAPMGSSFAALVSSKLNKNVNAAFETSPETEAIVLEPPLLDKVTKKRRKLVRRAFRGLSKTISGNLMSNLMEQGIYFEWLEYRQRKSTLRAGLTIDWRAPDIYSKLEFLRQHNISADIDIWDAEGRPVLCIEVKSVSGISTSPFHLTRREFESRKKCQDLDIPYEIVVYGFSSSEVDHVGGRPEVRRVIAATDVLNFTPDSYLCW